MTSLGLGSIDAIDHIMSDYDEYCMILNKELCLGSDPNFSCVKSSDTFEHGAFRFNDLWFGQMISCIGQMTFCIE